MPLWCHLTYCSIECFGYRRRLLASQVHADAGSDADTLFPDDDSDTVIDEEDSIIF